MKPGSKEETPREAGEEDQEQEPPIDSQSQQRIDNLLEGIIRGNNHTSDDRGELARIKERIGEVESAIQRLTEALHQAHGSAVTHSSDPGSREAPLRETGQRYLAKAHEEASPAQHAPTLPISELPSPIDEGEEPMCVYCTARRLFRRHNSSACIYFSVMTTDDHWQFVSQQRFCLRCLHTTASHDANQCPVPDPELCTSCPTPHEKQLKCRDATSHSNFFRTHKATKANALATAQQQQSRSIYHRRRDQTHR